MHAATLARGGEPVWIAVRHPHAEAQLASDIPEIERFFLLLRRFPKLNHVPWQRTSRELIGLLRDALDFRIRAQVSRQLRKNLKRVAGVRYPRCFARMCTASILVAERVEGIPIGEVLTHMKKDRGGAIDFLEQNRIDPIKLARRLFAGYLRQVAEDHLVVPAQRADDIILVGHNEVGYRIDPFQLPIEVDSSRAASVRSFLRSLVRRSYGGAVYPLFGLAEPLPPTDPGQLKKLVARELRAWGQRAEVRTLPSGERSFTGLFRSIVDVTRSRQIVFDPRVVRAFSAARPVEDVVFALDPTFEVGRELQRYMDQAMRRIARRMMKAASRRTATDWEAAKDAPYEAADSAARAADRLSLQALAFSNTPTTVAYLISRIFALFRLAFLTAAGMLFLRVLHYWHIIHLPSHSFLIHEAEVGYQNRIDYMILLLLALFFGYIFHRISVRFRERDSHLPTRGMV